MVNGWIAASLVYTAFEVVGEQASYRADIRNDLRNLGNQAEIARQNLAESIDSLNELKRANQLQTVNYQSRLEEVENRAVHLKDLYEQIEQTLPESRGNRFLRNIGIGTAWHFSSGITGAVGLGGTAFLIGSIGAQQRSGWRNAAMVAGSIAAGVVGWVAGTKLVQWVGRKINGRSEEQEQKLNQFQTNIRARVDECIAIREAIQQERREPAHHANEYTAAITSPGQVRSSMISTTVRDADTQLRAASASAPETIAPAVSDTKNAALAAQSSKIDAPAVSQPK